MSTVENYISGTTTTTTDVKAYGNKELNQDDFMTLLSAQLQHQDPMKPMENGEFIAEMAQFSELENSKNLTAAFEELSNTLMQSGSLQASLLVGKKVSYQTDKVSVAEDGATVHAKNAMGGSVKVEFFNEAGVSVHEATVESNNGRVIYTWDSEDNDYGDEFNVSMQHINSEEFLKPLATDLVRSVDVSGVEFNIELANGQSLQRNNLVEIIQN